VKSAPFPDGFGEGSRRVVLRYPLALVVGGRAVERSLRGGCRESGRWRVVRTGRNLPERRAERRAEHDRRKRLANHIRIVPGCAIGVKCSRIPIFGDTDWGFDHGTWLVLKLRAGEAAARVAVQRDPHPRFGKCRAQPPRAWRYGCHRAAERLGDRVRPAHGGRRHQRRPRAAGQLSRSGRARPARAPVIRPFPAPRLYCLGVAGPGGSVRSFCEGFQWPGISMRSFVLA
jgi:hypothetical protein